nr:hypothetical protein [Tanacetum cinerariifolium]
MLLKTQDRYWLEIRVAQKQTLNAKSNVTTHKNDSVNNQESQLSYVCFRLLSSKLTDVTDVKSAFLYGRIEEEIYGLCNEFERLMKDRFQMSSMRELTFFLEDGIFISQDKYVTEVLRKFILSDVKTASTPVDIEKPLVKDADDDNIDVHLYRSMIGSLMYLTTSRPDIIYACKKQTVVSTSTTEAEYVAAVSCCGQFWQSATTCTLNNREMEITATIDRAVKVVTEASVRRHLKLEDSEDFLNTSHIRYALTENPTIYVSLIQQFWQSATTCTLNNREMEITATIDRAVKVVTEASVRRHLKLEDSEGISVFPTTEIFDQLSLMGYVLNDDKLTFQQGKFSLQWRFLIHTLLHCLSPKKPLWEQFSSNIATALICLATNRTFNFSIMIFDGMVKNLDSKHKFLMYPRFIQVFLNKHKRLLHPHTRLYIAPTLTQKLFSNMKRASKGYIEVDIPLFPAMIVQDLIL